MSMPIKLTPAKVFKLVNYCVQYYLHNNYSQIYFTDKQWIDYLNEDNNINFPRVKVSTTQISFNKESIISHGLLISLNFNIYRFKRILKSINKGLDIEFAISRTLYVFLPELMLYNYIPNDNDYMPINKINTLIIHRQILNACLYHLSQLYDMHNHQFKYEYFCQRFPIKKFIIELLKHNINIKYDKYISGIYITKNKSKTDRQINSLLWNLYNLALNSNYVSDDLLYNLVYLDKQLNVHYTDYIDNIYYYLELHVFNNNNYLFIDIKTLKYLYDYFNFSPVQKKYIQYFLDKVNSLILLNDI